MAADLTDQASFDGLELSADVLVNNAGFQHVALVEEFPPERFAAMLALMVEAPFRLARRSCPHVRGAGLGPVANTPSTACGPPLQERVRRRQARAWRACPR